MKVTIQFGKAGEEYIISPETDFEQSYIEQAPKGKRPAAIELCHEEGAWFLLIRPTPTTEAAHE